MTRRRNSWPEGRRNEWCGRVALILALSLNTGRAGAVSPVDCNDNGRDDLMDVVQGLSPDCNANGIPDECEVSAIDFGLIPTYRGSHRIRTVITGDFNGDGRVDVSSGGYYGDVIVWLNRGGGRLEAAFYEITEPYAGDSRLSIAAGDLDGDADVDIVAATRHGVFLFRNDGAGVFAMERVSFDDSYEPTIALGDYDGDKDIDIAYFRGSGRPSKIFSNDGRGEFSETWSGLVSIQVPAAFFCDVDRNGEGDILVLSGSGYGGVAVLFGDGHGSFKVVPHPEFGVSPVCTVGDFDGDGYVDLGYVLREQSEIVVARNRRDGTFSAPHTPPDALRNLPIPEMVAAADLDGDGDLDLALAEHGRESILVFYNNGDGTFQRPILGRVAGGPRAIASADLDGDGRLDLLAGTYSSRGICVVRSWGDRTFQNLSAIRTPLADWSTAAVGDFDGDGDPDVIRGAPFRVWWNNGRGLWNKMGDTDDLKGADLITAAHLDGDGRSDLLTAWPGPDFAVRGFLSKGNGRFLETARVDLPGPVLGLAAADVNGDGRTDGLALLALGTERGLAVTLNEGDGRLKPGDIFPAPAVTGPPIAFDVDGDEDLDIILSNIRATGFTILENRGDGRYGEFGTFVFLSPTVAAPQFAVADMNGDGLGDVVYVAGVGIRQSRMYVALQHPGGVFDYGGGFAVGHQVSSVQVADLDDDGLSDVALLSTWAGCISVYRNGGDGRLAAPVNFDIRPDRTSVFDARTMFPALDIDGDGDRDLLIMGPREIVVARNASRVARRDLNHNGIPDECDPPVPVLPSAVPDRGG